MEWKNIVKAIQLLLDKGISAHAKDNYGNFPLHALAGLERINGNRCMLYVIQQDISDRRWQQYNRWYACI